MGVEGFWSRNHIDASIVYYCCERRYAKVDTRDVIALSVAAEIVSNIHLNSSEPAIPLPGNGRSLNLALKTQGFTHLNPTEFWNVDTLSIQFQVARLNIERIVPSAFLAVETRSLTFALEKICKSAVQIAKNGSMCRRKNFRNPWELRFIRLSEFPGKRLPIRLSAFLKYPVPSIDGPVPRESRGSRYACEVVSLRGRGCECDLVCEQHQMTPSTIETERNFYLVI